MKAEGLSVCLPGAERCPTLARRKVIQGLLPFWKLPLLQETHMLLCGHSYKSHHTAMRQMSPSKGASHASVHRCVRHGLPSPEPVSPSAAHPQPSLWLLTARLTPEAVHSAYIVPREWTQCLPDAPAEAVPKKSEVPFAHSGSSGSISVSQTLPHWTEVTTCAKPVWALCTRLVLV